MSPDFTPRREQRKTTASMAQQILNEMDDDQAKYFSKISGMSRTSSNVSGRHSRSLAK